jgi:WD40 repeat protein
MAYPRTVKLSKCERFLLASFTDNTVGIYCSRTGSILSKISGVPRSTTSYLISDNSQKLLFGNNNTLCLWNIAKGRL